MPSIFSGTQLPEWMQALYGETQKTAGEAGKLAGTGLAALLTMGQKEDVTDPTTGKPTGEQKPLGFFGALAQARMNQDNPLWKLQAQAAKVKILGDTAKLQSTYSTMGEQAKELETQHQEADSFAKWNALGFEARQSAREAGTAPSFKSQQYSAQDDRLQQVEMQARWHKQQTDNNSLQTRMLVKDQTDFIKGLESVDPESRAQIRAMTPNQDGTPSKMMWEALGYAQEAVQIKAETTRKQAELDAGPGAQITTRFTPKGTTTTIAPPKPGAGAASELKTVKLPSGETAVYMEGSKSLHILKTGTDELKARAALQEKHEADIAYRLALPKKAEMGPKVFGVIEKYRDDADKKFEAFVSRTQETAPAAAPNPKDPLGLGL